MGEGQAPPAASAVAGDTEDDEDWDLKGAAGLDDVEGTGAIRHVCGFQDRCRGKECKVPGTAAEAFEFATELVKQEASVDAGLST